MAVPHILRLPSAIFIQYDIPAVSIFDPPGGMRLELSWRDALDPGSSKYAPRALPSVGAEIRTSILVRHPPRADTAS